MCDCGAYDCKRCGPLQGFYGLPCERCGYKDFDCECEEEIEEEDDELPSNGAHFEVSTSHYKKTPQR